MCLQVARNPEFWERWEKYKKRMTSRKVDGFNNSGDDMSLEDLKDQVGDRLP